MAGRTAGRGRKPSMSFSMEQLGVSKGEALSPPLLQPSPSYPPLDHKPLPIQMTTEMSYLVELKRDFTEYMRESPNNVQTVVLNEDIERFCEDYDETIMTNKSEYESMHDWSRMPMELKSSRKRKLSDQQQSTQPNKKQKVVDIDKKLAELEKKESAQQADAEKKTKQEGEEEDESEEKEGERVKNENEIDEEMDDGTDYANEYFENGDNYYSEDENDDGPIFF
ncbi:DNA-directed RNA polymerase III subunit RPC7-like [Linepithema humile]|uniref:DNA-directed RNA polymerase III subunit RPC7-like n=1 Tax=Linepithema humile TaxID=83485 RepID=UPI00062305FD|nr:PREDICTED: DNA-directed RNA polymerase III subunit RPC7-like [Linepithema humile]